MKLKPIGKRVLVKRVIEELKTAGGLVLPDSMQKKDRYLIIAVGDGNDADGTHTWMEFEPGNIVYTEKYSGVEITQDEEKLLILRADDIIACEVQ